MTLQQLEYIIAVDRERHFVKAAESCFVTQATLSMMIKKLESEIEVRIFDRGTQPVTVTPEGVEIIRRAKRIRAEAAMLHAYTREVHNEVTGELRIGILPTLAPYLLPLFIKSFIEKFKDITVNVRELITSEIVDKLSTNDLDIGIVATPLTDPQIKEYPLFYEEFIAYAQGQGSGKRKKYLLTQDIDPSDLWLLEEGHCLRGQLINLCALKATKHGTAALHYEAGSLESLIHLVDKYGGITILPKLATLRLSAAQKKKLHDFAAPPPTREISLVTSTTFPRKRLITELHAEIMRAVQRYVATNQRGVRVVAL